MKNSHHALLANAAHAPTGCNGHAQGFQVIDDHVEMDSFREKVVAVVEAGAREGRLTPEFPASSADV